MNKPDVLNQRDSLDLKDLINANLQKAQGLTAVINAAIKSQDGVLDKDLEYATWALEDIIRDMNEANNELHERRENSNIRSIAQ